MRKHGKGSGCMGVLLCQPGIGVQMIADAEAAPVQPASGLKWPCAPCASAGRMAVGCLISRECLCMDVRTGREICRMPCVPGVSDMRVSACGRYLFQLSSEADCIHARCISSGELLCAAPAGVFPRCMRMDSRGQSLLCACGALNEARLFTAPELLAIRAIQTRHPCYAADFCREGLVLVCAVEGEDIRTAVYTLAFWAQEPRLIAELPGPPGGMCVCPDGKSALLSSRAGLAKVDLRTGALLWNCPEWALCLRVECVGSSALISDTTDGRVWLANHCRPRERRLLAQGADTQACFLSGSV